MAEHEARDEGRADPIFIVGTQRSGTTLLRLILDAHPRIAIGPETGFMRAVKTIKEIPDFHAGKGWYEPYGLSEEELNQRIREFYGSIFDDFARKQGKERWGEKTPFHRHHIGEIAAIFPRCQFLAMVRHPGAVAQSVGQWGYGWEHALQDWVRSNRSILRKAEALGADRVHVVRYEDLLLDSRRTIEEVIWFLDEPWDERLMSHHEVQAGRQGAAVTDGGTRVAEPLDPSRVDQWRTEVTEAELESMEAIAGELMRELGYRPNSAASMSRIHRVRGVWRRRLRQLVRARRSG